METDSESSWKKIKLKNKNRSFLIEIDPMIQDFDRKRRFLKIRSVRSSVSIKNLHFWKPVIFNQGEILVAMTDFYSEKSYNWSHWDHYVNFDRQLLAYKWTRVIINGPIICIYRLINLLCKKVCPFLYMSFILRTIKVKVERNSHLTPL